MTCFKTLHQDFELESYEFYHVRELILISLKPSFIAKYCIKSTRLGVSNYCIIWACEISVMCLYYSSSRRSIISD